MLKPIKQVMIFVGTSLMLCTPVLAIRELQDELGRIVHLPDNPQRVVCLAPSLTETVYALGLGPNVVGVTDFTDYPVEARRKPSVGGLSDASVEKIVSLHPDLVLSMGVINRAETVDELNHLGIPVFVVNPQGLQGILTSIQHVGDALNRGKDASRLLQHLEQERARVVNRVKGLYQPKILVVIWYDPVMTAGSKSFVTEIISAAGGRSVTGDMAQVWPQISLEEILRRSPDFLLLVRGGHEGFTEEELKAHAGWDQLKAVRDDHVIYLSDSLFHPSPVVFDALEQLARKLHPEAFAIRRVAP